ncbi:MAG: hypothetical protein WAZ77_15920 [Candidatus Nitrosopolaris sp.]|jgi:hypothetical protein
MTSDNNERDSRLRKLNEDLTAGFGNYMKQEIAQIRENYVRRFDYEMLEVENYRRKGDYINAAIHLSFAQAINSYLKTF